MELHTLSPAAGYTQADVTASPCCSPAGRSTCAPIRRASCSARMRTSRASRRVMGRTLPGRRGGRRRRRWRSSPRTRRRTAIWPPSWCGISSPTTRRPMRCAGSRACCATPAAIWVQASLALIDLPDAWQPGAKLRTPAGFRHRHAARPGLAAPTRQPRSASASSAGLGQPLFERAAAERLARPRRRLGRARGDAAADRLGLFGWPAAPRTPTRCWSPTASLGPLLRPETAHAVQHAGSRRDALTLVAHLAGVPAPMTQVHRTDNAPRQPAGPGGRHGVRRPGRADDAGAGGGADRRAASWW